MTSEGPDALHVEQALERGEFRVRLSGSLCLEPLRGRSEVLSALLRTGASGAERIVLDLHGVKESDDYGIAFLVDLMREAFNYGVEIELEGSNASFERRMELYRKPGLLDPDPTPEQASGSLERLGGGVLKLLEGYVMSCLLVARTARQILIAPLVEGRPFLVRVLDQMARAGVGGLPVVGLIAFLVGLILAFQAAYQLRAFGADIFVADLVGVSMLREFGPLITAILVAGRSGSAMTAELATMQVGEEVDALQVMGVDPVRFLVAPRVLALVMVMPCLVVFADVLGVAAGLLVAVFGLGIGLEHYLEQTQQALELADLYSGLGKSLLFSGLIGIISCRRGLSVRGGAEAVGRATTLSVVVSILSIIVADGLFTAYVFFVD